MFFVLGQEIEFSINEGEFGIDRLDLVGATDLPLSNPHFFLSHALHLIRKEPLSGCLADAKDPGNGHLPFQGGHLLLEFISDFIQRKLLVIQAIKLGQQILCFQFQFQFPAHQVLTPCHR